MMGFTILNCILGGQTLSAATVHRDGSGGVSWNVGIVVIAVVSLLVSPPTLPVCSLLTVCTAQISFCGYRVLNW